eukprot:14359280-Alexandrium_andersonii.AAC.1
MREEGWSGCEDQALVRNALLEALDDESAAREDWNLLNANPSRRNDALLPARNPVVDAHVLFDLQILNGLKLCLDAHPKLSGGEKAICGPGPRI